MSHIETLDARSHLMESSEEFRKLAAQHSDFDRRIEELASKRFPTAEEQEEEHRLKIEKLHLKDRMQDMVEDYGQAH